MVKIIGISGRKQSGKNTVANYINGCVLKDLNMINSFYIDSNGSLTVNTENSEGHSGYGILDVTRKDDVFIEYAHKELWPFIKVYHFADYLKDLSVNLFGLKPDHVYGTDAQKNETTNIDWSSMPYNDGKSGKMTNREFLEHFGTKIVRRIKSNAWVEATLNKIIREDSKLAIIPDVRFPNEVEAIKDNGGIVLRLTRNIHNSQVECESILDKENYDWSNFDNIIDNTSLSIDELSDYLNNISHIWKI